MFKISKNTFGSYRFEQEKSEYQRTEQNEYIHCIILRMALKRRKKNL